MVSPTLHGQVTQRAAAIERTDVPNHCSRNVSSVARRDGPKVGQKNSPHSFAASFETFFYGSIVRHGAADNGHAGDWFIFSFGRTDVVLRLTDLEQELRIVSEPEGPPFKKGAF